MNHVGDCFLPNRPPLNAEREPLAILVSGGLDSAILLGESVQHGRTTFPLYIRSGLYWEVAELHRLRLFLHAIRHPALRPLTMLELPVADLYGAHWSITGDNAPDANSPNEAVFLPGRNILLLAKALLWCHLQDVPVLALGLLESNPFRDADSLFFETFQAAVNRAMAGAIEVRQPYAGLSKAEVMQRGRHLPLVLTFSCIRPIDGEHCGQCNKCAERRRAFADAGMADPTVYLGRAHVSRDA
jgi:7-cyano-7-deazaguanine synthase